MPRNTAKVGKEREEEECMLININVKKQVSNLKEKKKQVRKNFMRTKMDSVCWLLRMYRMCFSEKHCFCARFAWEQISCQSIQ